MKKIFFRCALSLYIISMFSCTSNDVKEISGSIVFNDIGSHVFNINADNIEATITLTGPNHGETLVFEKVQLFRTSNYNVKIGSKSTGELKSELLDNLVVMYAVGSGEANKSGFMNLTDTGYVKIDWKGFN